MKLNLRLALTTLTLPAVVAQGCGSNPEIVRPLPSTEGAGGQAQGGSNQGGDAIFSTGSTMPGCSGLACQQVVCPDGTTTTLTGTVYEPAGTLPLYNVLVYVPNEALAPLDDSGATCEQCNFVSGDPLVSALTDTHGHFVLEDVPVGSAIPLVIQIGKWRRELVVSTVEACVENSLTDVESTSLPSKQSEGHLPRIALTTGHADPLECLLRKIGIEAEEFTPPSGTGRVNLYAGVGGSAKYAPALNDGAAFDPAPTFWSSLDSLRKYDILLLACEGAQYVQQKPPQAREAMQQYADLGGRIFMSHWHNVWLEKGPLPWPHTADWSFQSDPQEPYFGLVDWSFPKGLALSEWLVNVGASATPGSLPITAPQHTVDGVQESFVRPWITGSGVDPGSVKYFTFNTPGGANDDELCGRIVFSDIHVSSMDTVGADFPDGCTTTGLSPQEKALVFMLFDLSSCIQPDEDTPVVPK